MAWCGDSGCLACTGDDKDGEVFRAGDEASALAAFLRLEGGFGSFAGERRIPLLGGVLVLALIPMRKTGRDGEEVLGWSNGGGGGAAVSWNGDCMFFSSSSLTSFLPI